MKNIKYWYLLLIISMIGIVVLAINIRLGIGIEADSISYILAARNLLNGDGLKDLHSGAMTPMTHFPPLYSTILAIIGIVGIDPLAGSELLALITFGINIFLVGFIVYHYTKSRWLSILASLFMLSSINMLVIHSFAWTEPLFIMFTLLTIFFWANYLETNLKKFLYLSATMTALAWLDRYVGITLIITSIITLLILSKTNLKAKIKNSVYFLVISCLPMSLWLLRNILVANSATNRSFFFHPISIIQIKKGFYTISHWLFTDSIVANIYIGLIILNLVILILYYNHKLQISYKLNNKLKKFLAINSIFIFVYLIFLIISISFLDAATPLDYRILAPIFPLVLIIILFLVYNIYQSFQKQQVTIVTTLFLFFTLFVALIYSYYTINFVKQNTIIDIHSIRQKSIIIQSIKQLPPNVIIYTNKPNWLFWLTNRLSFIIPEKNNAFNHSTNYQYSTQMNEIKKKIDDNTVFINFKPSYELTEKELMKVLPLQLIQKDMFGAIYKMKTESKFESKK